MKFLKNFFNDESKIVGLCAFKTMRPKYAQTALKADIFFNPFESNKPFETNFKQNILLL